MRGQYILEMRNITKEFPGVKALSAVNLQIKPGEIHALVGEKRRWEIDLNEGAQRRLSYGDLHRGNSG
jgi:ABC-type phosphonate transport system ATPase subunit